MKKYDYVLVGSCLFNGVFAYLARQTGKKCLVVERRDISAEIFTVRIWKASMCINTAPISSIPATGKCGIS